MKKSYIAGLLVLFQIISIHSAKAGDFDWLNNLNVRAEADASGFNLSLASRFQIGDVEVNAVLGQVERAADAYMVFRLSELSHQTTHDVINAYNNNKQHGWGKMAKALGIKPGSKEFHELKNGHDLDESKGQSSSHSEKKDNRNNKQKKKNKGDAAH